MSLSKSWKDNPMLEIRQCFCNLGGCGQVWLYRLPTEVLRHQECGESLVTYIGQIVIRV